MIEYDINFTCNFFELIVFKALREEAKRGHLVTTTL